MQLYEYQDTQTVEVSLTESPTPARCPTSLTYGVQISNPSKVMSLHDLS